jgi:polysaccharide biosynthesis protein PslA
VYLGLAALSHCYSAEVFERSRLGLFRSWRVLLASSAVILFVAYFLKASDQFSRAVFLIGVSGAFVLLALNRVLARALIARILDGTVFTTVVVLDYGIQADGLDSGLIIRADEIGFDPSSNDPVTFHQFAEVVSAADRLVVLCHYERYSAWASALKSMAVNGEIVTDEHDHLGLLGLGRLGRWRTMVVAAGPLRLQDRIAKRAFDIIFSTLAIIVLAPLMFAVACLIKAESKGPILFRQQRIGRDNLIFEMLKFRSMYVDRCDQDGSQLTLRQDPRVTRIGQLIRRTSIDELPQLFNVLRGDMSIVGPRPHALSAKAADKLYWDVDPRYRQRHTVKPGLTGLAQVRGFRGNTEKTEDLTNRLQSDLEYVADWSVWRDVQIVLQTFFVLRHGNAF